ncbi:DeoR/GlpR family transcriptional regulator [Lonepinella koalarum]|uniref:DeoR family transcriptional regulator n=1 Tax=Lonepinella koalarum TaxID=53417 RepID=A0A4R1KZS0_9PAST|nr:DeoR/GlpR family transcriptional regulator [Lonepinella koalarum]MDH2925943.1 transcriptional regulator [Lonepinella koalarum]TCK71095.1 DeoR family transcriptional regulator [Lonepinella koalarum]TFJ90824.1 DeoR/GlpR family transcriptional regulator [Lonepinella koalarum]TYG34608.1 DeoR/GlpR family transcriptional regulator [Lonepinella koalarum]
MKQSVRHQKIIDLVKQEGYVSTEELVDILNVSPQTIRRDLNTLAEQDLIRRHHGGAAHPSSAENSDYADRKEFLLQEKNKIAQAAVKLIPNGSSLFIDIGTTPEAVANALLNHKDLRIVTNNINAAYILMKNNSFHITMAGGTLRHQDGGIIGEATVAFISQFRLDFGILGISSIDLDGSLLDYDYHEVQVKRAIIENSRQTLLVSDHSKFNRHAMVKLGNLTDMDYFVTDGFLPLSIKEKLALSNVVVIEG